MRIERQQKTTKPQKSISLERVHIMQLLPVHYFSSKRSRGSALIGTLVMVGILAMGVAVMISSSSRSIRGSRDKIMYEEAYQAALSGTHVARAWLIDPQLGAKMRYDNGLETDLKALVKKAKQMNEKIVADNYQPESSLYGTSRFAAAGIDVSNTPLPDGRVVVYEFDSTNPIVSFINDADDKQFDDSLFAGTPAKGHRNYVKSVRITTPGTTDDTSCSLRQTTFIVESTGVSEYAGAVKERTVQQRVLLHPNEPTAPLLSTEEAVISNGGLGIQGSSHANIHWAPVLAKDNIEVNFLAPLTYDSLLKQWTLQTSTEGTGKKFNAAGIYTENSFHKFTDQVVDKWLKYMAGSEGKLISDDGELFKNIQSVDVTDFFEQLQNGAFDETNDLRLDNLNLAGKYSESGTLLTDVLDANLLNSNGLLTSEDGELEGALAQGLSSVDAKIDGFFEGISYEDLKQYAKEHNGYYTYDGKVFRDATGKKVTKLPDMKEQLNVTGSTAYDPLGENGMADRVLFIDGPNQADDASDVVPNPEYSGNAPLPNFWKGMLYAHGDVSVGGASSPSYVIRTPEQYGAYKSDPVTNSNNHYTAQSVFFDGILVSAGKAHLGGNSTIYGTLAAHDGLGIDLGGSPTIFYNAANKDGRLKNDESELAEYRVIAGRLYEIVPSNS